MRSGQAGCCTFVVGMMMLSWSARVQAHPAGQPAGMSFVEIGTNHQSLTAGYPDQNGLYVRTVLRQGDHNTWGGELVRQQEFGDQGIYYSATNTHIFTPDWYSSVSLGSSSGGFFYPRLRADAFLNRKWGRQRRLITTAGIGYYAAKDTHRDSSLFLGSTYYFRQPWILEGGVRWDQSMPGSVTSRSQFVALTQGRNGRYYLTLRIGTGREAYQLIGPSAALADFPSHEVSLIWRQWVGKDWGYNLVGAYYQNPSYGREGLSIGTFKTF